jgi:hypothetical protein
MSWKAKPTPGIHVGNSCRWLKIELSRQKRPQNLDLFLNAIDHDPHLSVSMIGQVIDPSEF